MSKGVWNTYFSVRLSSWLCGPGATTGRAPVSCCLPLGDHTLRPHDYSPLEDGPPRLLSLHYSCYYQQYDNTCHARCDKVTTYLLIPALCYRARRPGFGSRTLAPSFDGWWLQVGGASVPLQPSVLYCLL